MSLILDALRKSEAERQVGRPPGLLSPGPTAEPPAARRWWIPLLLIVLLGVGGGSWWLGRQGAAPGAVHTAAPSQAPPAATSAPASAGDPTASDPSTPISTAAVAKPIEPPARSTPPPARNDALVGSDSARTAASAAATVTAADAATSPVAPVEPPAVVGDATAMRVPLARIEHMPISERARLPSLKLSVHLFAEQPERRFAIIDGRRVTDDEKLADNLAVKAIVPEGVLLVFEGRTWLLPRP